MRSAGSAEARGSSVRGLLLTAAAVLAAAAIGGGLWLASRPPPDRVIESVRFPARITTKGRSLQLIGAGTRRVMMWRPYAAALYLEHPVKSAAEVVKSVQEKRVHLHLLADLDRVQIDWSFRHAVERNNPQTASQLAPQLAVLYGALRDAKRGEDIVISYEPGVGTSVTTGKDQVPTLPGAALGSAMMSIWFGPLSVDADLQREMLGL